jgi:hypothetical protein
MQHDFILLDRSQSMGLKGRWEEALDSINAYVKKLADDNVDTGVTLAVFDKSDGNFCFEVVRDRITPKTWKPVGNEDAKPRGWTPLRDAIGRLITRARAGFNGEQYDKVAIIIVTDGEENSSKEVSHGQARALLDDCRAKGWQVIFLGADFENLAQAQSFGNAAGQTVSASVGSFADAMRMTAAKRGAYGSVGATMSYSDDEKKSLSGD